MIDLKCKDCNFLIVMGCDVCHDGEDKLCLGCLLQRKDARIAELEESLHLANGTADLAIKHRDAAESELETERDKMIADLEKISDALNLDAESPAGADTKAIIKRIKQWDSDRESAWAELKADNSALHDTLHGVAGIVETQKAELAKLREVVSYTKDGVAVGVGSVVYVSTPHRVFKCAVQQYAREIGLPMSSVFVAHEISDCYSTREAAESADAEGGGHV